MPSAFPSEATVVLTKYQQWGNIDANDMATIPQATTDNVVASFLANGLAYTGLGVTANADAKGVTVATGLLYNLGGGYPLRAAANLDLTPYINAIPDTVQSQIILVVANGGTSNVQETRTLEDASQKPTNPADLWPTVQQVITTRAARALTPNVVAGTIAVTPAVPPFNPLLCLLATLTIDKTGVTSVVQNTGSQITRLDQLDKIVDALSATVALQSAALQGTITDLAGLKAAAATQLTLLQSEITALQQQLTALTNKQTSQGTAGTLYTETDFYTSVTSITVQPTNPTYGLGGGLTFPVVANGVAVQPTTQTNAYWKVVNNKLRRVTNEGGEVLRQEGGTGFFAFDTVSPINTPVTLKGFGIQRTRYGAAYPAQSVAPLLAAGDPTQIFAQNPAAFAYLPSWDDWREDNPELVHANGFWNDLTSRGFWTPEIAAPPITNVPGIMQPVVLGADQVIEHVWLPSWKRGTNSQPVRMLICLDNANAPDFSQAIADVTVASVGNTYDNVVYGQTITDFALPYPLYLQGGTRIWFVFVSPGNDRIGMGAPLPAIFQRQPPAAAIVMSPSGAYSQYSADTPFIGLSLISSAIPGPATVDVPLVNLYQQTGIDQVDIALPALIPPGCSVAFGIYDAQGRFQQFAAIPLGGISLLAARPSSLPIVMRMTGNVVIDLAGSVAGAAMATAAKQAGTFSVESKVFAVPGGAPFSKVSRDVTLSKFDPATHTYTEQLETGAGYATLTAPTKTIAPALQPDGTYLVHFEWALGTAVTSCKLLMGGNAADTTKVFSEPKVTTNLAA